MKFGFVAKHRGAWPVTLMCEALGVSRSGFYAWLSGPEASAAWKTKYWARMFVRAFMGSDRTYGARRVWHDVLALGQRCGLHRIERLMREQALRARPRRQRTAEGPGRAQRHRRQHPGPPVRGRRRRTRSGWPTSPTSGRPKAGCMWPRCWTCTRGESSAGRCRHSMTSQLVADALMMAVWRRGKPRSCCITRTRAASTPASTSRSC